MITSEKVVFEAKKREFSNFMVQSCSVLEVFDCLHF